MYVSYKKIKDHFFSSSLPIKITKHTKKQKIVEETEQASEPDSDMAGMLVY